MKRFYLSFIASLLSVVIFSNMFLPQVYALNIAAETKSQSESQSDPMNMDTLVAFEIDTEPEAELEPEAEPEAEVENTSDINAEESALQKPETTENIEQPEITYAISTEVPGLNYSISSGKVTITDYTGSATNLVVPGYIDDLPVTSIGSNAFNNCDSLNNVALPDTITTIGYYAFRNCDNLVSINLPLSIKTFGTIHVGNLNYISEAFANCPKLKNITIPEGMVALPSSSFEGAKSIETFVLPRTLTSIGKEAFKNCTGLINVNIPDGVTSLGEEAFYNCDGLKSIDLPEGITSIGNSTFNDCDNIETLKLPNSVTSIGYYAFKNCDNLVSINLPLSIKTFGTINVGNLNYISEAFANCPKLKNITIPEGMVALPSSSFEGAKSIETFVLPRTLTSIGREAFKNCTGLTNINIPDGVTSLGEEAFYNCDGLKSIDLPEGITSIGNSTFNGCDNIETLKLPNSVTSIGYYAFRNCDNLVSINLPLSIKTFGTIHVGNLNYISEAFANCPKLKNITIPEGMVALPSSSFEGAKSIETFVLPRTLTSIGKEAFKNCTGLINVNIPDGVENVNSEAFLGCTNMSYITIPQSVTSISSSAFNSTPNLTFHTELNSIGTIYAIDNNKPVITSNNNAGYTGDKLNRGLSSYVVDTNGALTNGYVQITVDLSVKEEEWSGLSNKELTVKIPTGTQLVEASMRVNDTIVTDYELGNNTVTIPITEKDTVFRASLQVVSQGKFYSYALFNYRENNVNTRDVISVVIEDFDAFTLSTDERTSQSTISVQGIASPNKDVELYVDNVLQATVASNLVGAYKADITLPVESGKSSFLIKATSVSSSGDATSAEQQVRYATNTPELTSFVFFQSGTTTNGIDLYDYAQKGLRPSITHIGSKFPYRFEVAFTNPDLIESVYVTSTRNNLKTSIPGIYDETLGMFVAVGHFVDDEPMYVPGILKVEYTLKNRGAMVGGAVDWNEIASYENPAFDNATVTKTEQNGVTTGTIDFTGVDEALDNKGINYTVGSYQGEYGNTAEEVRRYAENNDAIRVYDLQGEDGSNYVAVVDYAKDATISYVISSAEAIFEDAVEFKLHSLSVTDPKFAELFDFANTVSTVSTIAGAAFDMYNIDKDHDKLIDEIWQSSSIVDKDEAIRKAEALKNDKQMFSLMMTALPLLVAGGAVTAPVLLFTGMMAVLSQSSDFFWEHRISQITGGSHMINWHIDPSGYVYDTALGHDARLQGVTTTVYCILTDYSEDFFDNKPADNVYGELWDASTASQENPLITDVNGRYAWDVPEGWWRVKYEKDGYETTYSDWLPVPPPQTEVNIGMTRVPDPNAKDITGEIKSYNPMLQTRIALYDAEDENHIDWKYLAILDPDVNATGEITQSFTIEGISQGTYDLVVTKGAHIDYIITDLVVGSADLDLTSSLNADIRTITMVAGDVNEDGKINFNDLSEMRNSVNFGQNVDYNDLTAIADLNGDGILNSEDIKIAAAPQGYNSDAEDYVIAY